VAEKALWSDSCMYVDVDLPGRICGNSFGYIYNTTGGEGNLKGLLNLQGRRLVER